MKNAVALLLVCIPFLIKSQTNAEKEGAYFEQSSGNNEPLTKKNIEFIATYLQCSSEDGFGIFYNNMHPIDSVIGIKGYAMSVINNIVTKEEIDPQLFSNSLSFSGNPQWSKLETRIYKKYKREIASEVILDGKLKWYNKKQDWPKVVKYSVKKNRKTRYRHQ